MMWQGLDRRQFPRAQYPCKVVVLRSDLKETFSTHTENIGAGGVCVTLPRELPKFCPVEILLYLKDAGGPIECPGRIVWVIRREDIFDMGIEFIDLKESDFLRIEAVIRECLRKLRE